MVLSPTQRKELRQSGYRIKQFERVLKPGEKAADGLRPDEPGGDYDSFPAVHDPTGAPVAPYNSDGSVRTIDAQWTSAWVHYKMSQKKNSFAVIKQFHGGRK